MSNSLVFLEPNKIDTIPFTTSKVISEWVGIEHRKLKISIRKHQSALETFGRIGLIVSASYGAETSVGRPEESYQLNEQQATLLITFLKNTPIVVKFKTELVKQFYLMRTELLKRQVNREQLKPIRRELTDVIQEKEPDNKWAYKLYTDLAYKAGVGKNAAQIRKDRNAGKKAVAVDYMTANEIERISKLQSQIAVLKEMGMEYQQIKALVLEGKLIGKIA